MEDKPNGGEDNDETVDEDDVICEESFSDSFSEEDGEVAVDWNGSQNFEAPLTEKEIEELVDELLEVESKAAEAQEALEEESLQKVEQEVREELAVNLKGDGLEKAVEEEMAALREEWEETLDDLETESAHLLEQLDGANVDLPRIYKLIESEAPNGCCTEAWKKRTHWAGTEAASDAVKSVKDAEFHLETLRPVKRHRGKTLEAGASGYLAKKVCADAIGEGSTENCVVEWDSFNKLFSDHTSKEDAVFGSKQWASVYLANTPQQAAAMGLKFPGVDEVEEIDDIDDNSSDPFFADAIANEKELVLSEEQRKKYKKVKEEDDLSLDQKLRLNLKRRRHIKKSRQKATGHSGHAESALNDNEGATCEESKVAELASCGLPVDSLEEKNKLNGYPCSSKRLCDDEVLDSEAKRRRTTMLEIDDESMKADACSENVYEMFYCTVCSKVAMEIHEHPLLKVIVCGHCKCVIEAKMRDLQGLESYCGWCGSSSDLLGCKTCKLMFCISCIKKNIGVDCLPEDLSLGWKCCSCSPSMLKQLTLELEKAVDSQDSTVSSSDSESDDEIGASISKSGKKKIRRILDDTELGEETKRKIAMEKERQERLKSLKAQFSATPMMMNASTCNGSLPEGATSEVLGDASTGFIVNVVREKGEDAVRIPPSISSKLKTHQVAGIRFMWENIIQSIRNVKAGDKGLGCILAHTMGLGKTFQVIAFLYTAMRSVDLGLKTALVVTPVNVLHNWRQEFRKWQPKELKPLRIYMLEDKSREQQRAELLMKWRRKGGVFLIGYTSFRNLSLGKNMKDRNSAKEICSALQEGPDILVCDEAHIIKNTKAEITQALKLVKSQRRIALTGSPLQNNLMEYYCMVDFVREGFLGSMHEFRNRFQNPIEYGQHANSTAKDVRIMNQRSHILYEQLKGFVQRMDMSVVKKDLPPKTVFVVAVKSSLLQRKLYKRFLDVHGLIGKAEGIRKNFFAAYQTLAQICNHPWILQLMKDRGYAKREDNPEDSSSDENNDSNFGTGEKVKAKVDKGFLHEGWWNKLLNQHYHQEIEYSGKMVLLLDILTMCTEVGDKALVFSQSIATLDLIESYLSKLRRLGKKGKNWKQGKDWFRIDGKTEGSERQRLVDAFNNPQNERVKCTLISTRAGALGINLYAANRVIIIDGSWNPTHDLQAIYRAWRYGQKKPVYAYRLVAHGTLEEKIYKRQVKKEGLAARVVDRQQVLRSMSKEEISDLFNFSEDENLDVLPETAEKNRHVNDADNCRKSKDSLNLNSSDCPRNCSSDKLMEKLLNRHRLRWIMNFHEHETLLQENEEEKLTKEEQDLAWEVFKKSMNMEEGQRAPVDIEWQEVSRVVVDESTLDQKQSSQIPSSTLQARGSMLDPLANVPSRYSMPVRKCTNVSHMYTLRLQGTKVGCSTICGGCGQDICWEDLKK